MAAKAKKSTIEVVDTPEIKAQRLLDLRAKIKAMEQQEVELIAELRAYVKDTGAKDVGNLQAYEKTSAAKLEGLENKALKVAQEQLINSLDPTYVKKALDVGKMFAALQTDKALVGHLAEKGLKITQGVDIYFKAK
jgi:hypothetical protein